MDKISYKKSAIVWAISSFVFLLYGLCFLFEADFLAVDKVVKFIQEIDTSYIFAAAFITIFIESIYVIGTFFPGSSLVLMFAIIAAINNMSNFSLVIFAIFAGWTLSTLVNILIGKLGSTAGIVHNKAKENYWISWFPAFRATEEVAQISCGVKPIRVFISSFKIKFVTSLIMAGIAFALSKTADINNVSSEEGYLASFLACAICLTVAVFKFINYKKQ